MSNPNISRMERNSRIIMAGILFIGVALSLGSWFYMLMAVLLGISGVTGQCAMIKIMNKLTSGESGDTQS